MGTISTPTPKYTNGPVDHIEGFRVGDYVKVGRKIGVVTDLHKKSKELEYAYHNGMKVAYCNCTPEKAKHLSEEEVVAHVQKKGCNSLLDAASRANS